MVGGGGLEQFSVSPRPLGFGFGTKGFWAKGLGPGLDNRNGSRFGLWYCNQNLIAPPQQQCFSQVIILKKKPVR